MKLKIVAFSLLLGLTTLLGACQTETPTETIDESAPAEETETPGATDTETPGATEEEMSDEATDEEMSDEATDEETPEEETSPE